MVKNITFKKPSMGFMKIGALNDLGRNECYLVDRGAICNSTADRSGFRPSSLPSDSQNGGTRKMRQVPAPRFAIIPSIHPWIMIMFISPWLGAKCTSATKVADGQTVMPSDCRP